MSTNDATDNLVNPSSSSQGGSDVVSAGENAAGGETPRIFPRQNLAGSQRGVQIITGQNIVSDPTTSNPVISMSGPTQGITIIDPKTQNPRIIEGLLPDGTYGMWVSQPEINVNTASLEDLVFNSNQNVFKIVGQGSTTLTWGDVTVSAVGVHLASEVLNQIPHNLGYVPVVLGFQGDLVGSFTTLPYTSKVRQDGTGSPPTYKSQGVVTVTIAVDATNVYVEALQDIYVFTAASTTYAGQTLDVTYYLLQETVPGS